ncbi:hypothetical protein K435DRAFT_755941 [Dendrothele bispora CBS 962.96]|uniref:Uncharacterized protein n=1 Tax=Dendrothele bispora (strain CBS 962.96) TaxID=1314807 RepID=A0A4S8M045_DENBC|nr:hypothetical protein K435DRAFT_755941 [Dendrothele bispora CBS 962.96]
MLQLDLDASSSVTSEASAPPSPTKRPRPPSLRLDHVGVDPSELIGKVLSRARRSPKHPVITLDFTDNTSFQILVDGYNPRLRGIPKELEMDEFFDELVAAGLVDLEIVDCALITLQDKAFDRTADARWDQKHLGIAIKFAEENPHWHCVWATLREFDDSLKSCIFRSYDDVYIDRLDRSPRKRSSPRKMAFPKS